MSYDLQAESLRRFDQLVAEGQIIFQDAPPMIVPAKPFNVSVLSIHPIMRHDEEMGKEQLQLTLCLDIKKN